MKPSRDKLLYLITCGTFTATVYGWDPFDAVSTAIHLMKHEYNTDVRGTILIKVEKLS